ncbi:MAG: hypothetical protein WEA61_07500 [Anaerolineales bacterium]
MKKAILGICSATVLLLVAAFPAMAQVSTTVTGVVQSVDLAAASFTMLTAEGTILTVVMPEGTDLSTLVVGTNAEVTGELAEDGTFVATGVVVLPDGEVTTGNSGFYCSNPDVTLPALGTVAESYDAGYAAALDLFCGGGFGIGGVALTLATSQATGLTPEEIAAMRADMGWGQIWKALEDAGDDSGVDVTDADDDHGNRPAWAGKNDERGGGDPGNGNGRGNGQGNGNGGGKP